MTTLFRVLLDSSIRVSLVALLVGLALLAAKVRSGGLRHAAWLAVLLTMPLMPFLPYVVPNVAVPIDAVPGIVAVTLPSAAPAAAPSPSDFARAATSTAPPFDPPAPRTPIWPAVVSTLYVAGALVLLRRLLTGWFAAQRVLRSCRPVPVQDATVYESAIVSAPVTVGLWTQRVLLPSDWRTWSADKLRAVLAHEFAHVARRDTITSLLAQLNRCVFWFHPLAWWLERHLAIAAEQACDDAGVRAIGERHKYAQVLLEIADTVRLRGSRLSLQGVGAIDGGGMLGGRIDRILHGAPIAPVTRTRRAVVALVCGAAIFLVAACRQSSVYSQELKPDPEYVRLQAEQKAAADFTAAARAMNAEQVAEAEAAVARNPQDLDMRKKLMLFYQTSGRKLLGDEKTIAQFRAHKLWFIQNHPDDQYASLMNPLSDPAGYDQARKLWLAAVERPDVSAPALLQAAAFFQIGDQALAEKVLLRVKEPNGKLTNRLASIYAAALAGAPLTPYAQEVRARLAASEDPNLLAETGLVLMRTEGRPGTSTDSATLIRTYVSRAHELDPTSMRAATALAMLRGRQQNDRIRSLGNEPSEAQYQAAAALPDAERFEVLPALAEHAYMRGDMLDYYDRNPAAGRAAWALARRYAQDTLRLAPRFTGDANYGAAVYKANMTLGCYAMRVDGDTKASAKYLLAASQAPTADNAMDYFMLRLPVALLKYGGPAGRAAVIEYLERYGKRVHRPDIDLLHAAQQLRQGYMPIWYQYQAAKLK